MLTPRVATPSVVPWFGCAALAFLIALVQYVFWGQVRVDWADEGILWYGTRAVLAGQVPIRDFYPYDPGRFYWGAFFSRWLGDGLLALRLSEALFQGLTLTFGLLALRRVFSTGVALAVGGVCTVLWQFWGFRYFDAGLPLVAVFLALRLVEKPSGLRHAMAGLFAGVGVFFGLNHGLYILSAFFSLSLFLIWKQKSDEALTRLGCLGAGFLVGLTPLLLMMVRIAGFFEAYWERLGYHGIRLGQGATDFSRAVAWPWELSWEVVTHLVPGFWIKLLTYTNLWLQGAALTTLLCLTSAGAIRVIRFGPERLSKESLFVASVFMSVFYLHHVWARRDITHIGEGMFPVLAALCAWARAMARSSVMPLWLARTWAGWAMVLTVGAALPLSNPFFFALVPKNSMTPYPFGKDAIWISKKDAFALDRVKRMVEAHVPGQEPLLIAPILTTLYPVLGRFSPVREIYFFQEPSAVFQEDTVRQLEQKKVRWALVGDPFLDGRPERAFSKTHPILWNYLMSHFDVVSEEQPWPGTFLLNRTAEEFSG